MRYCVVFFLLADDMTHASLFRPSLSKSRVRRSLIRVSSTKQARNRPQEHRRNCIFWSNRTKSSGYVLALLLPYASTEYNAGTFSIGRTSRARDQAPTYRGVYGRLASGSSRPSAYRSLQCRVMGLLVLYIYYYMTPNPILVSCSATRKDTLVTLSSASKGR